MAALSHELRNPLTSVQTSLAVLARANPDGPEARKATDVASREVDNLARVLDVLLDSARVSNGGIHLQRRRTELGELVRRTVEAHRWLFEERGIAVEYQLARELLWAEVDAMRLIRAFAQLLVNAMTGTPAGGHVEVSLRPDRGWAVVSVAARRQRRGQERRTGLRLPVRDPPTVRGALVDGLGPRDGEAFARRDVVVEVQGEERRRQPGPHQAVKACGSAPAARARMGTAARMR